MKKLILVLTVMVLVTGIMSLACAEATGMASFLAQVETTDVYGNPFNALIFANGLTMVNIWATWCGPCVHEIPELAAISREYAGRIQLVGILLDGMSGDRKTLDTDALTCAQNVLESAGAAYPCIVPTEEIYNLMDKKSVTAIPTTWFIDAQGNILYEEIGSHDVRGWRTIIDGVLSRLNVTNVLGDTDLSQYNTLNVGMATPEVIALKIRLYDLGYYVARHETQLYTSSTADVVKMFQCANGLPETGIATPETQALLYSEKAIPKQ